MKRRFATGLTCFSLIIGSHHLQGQADTTQNVREGALNVHVGKLIKIHGAYPENDITTMTELHVAWKLQGKKQWHGAYRNPSAGISIVHAQFGKQDILGQAIAVIPNMRFERWKNETRWSWRVGLGIAGFNKPYDAIDNPQNLVIGSRFTNMSMARFEMSKRLSKQTRYSIGLSLTHCSDSHLAVPNIGANIVALTAGISYCRYPERIHSRKGKNDKERIHDKWKIGAQFIYGVHEFQGTLRPADGPMYYVYGEGICMTKSFTAFRKFSIGLNHHYYTSYYDYMKSQELFPPGTDIKQKAHNVVLYAGYEWSYGKCSLFIQGGINLYDPFLHEINKVWDLPKHGSLYIYTANKIGYRYYMLKQSKTQEHLLHPYLHIAVKTNGGTADFFEVAVGVDIRTSRKHAG